MSEINTEYLQKCIDTLSKSYELLKKTDEGSIDYEVFRNALVKGFELVLEQSGKLLKKRITPYLSSKKAADELSFKDIFRNAHKHSLLSADEVLRWFEYRDNRNSTAHDYGRAFAEQTLTLIESFLADVKNLKKVIENDQPEE